MDTSHAQFREDLAILDAFGPEHRGFFVDVGANDGITGSNSYLLEKRGWRGVLVEPSVALADTCRRLRPGSVVVNKAVVNDPAVTSVDYYEYLPSPTGARFDGYSSVGAPSPYGEKAILAGAQLKTSKVPACRMDAILDEFAGDAPIDVLSVDVEGFELEVFRGMSFERHCPRVIVVEDNSFGADLAVPDLLAKHGYAPVFRSFVNVWYLRAGDPIGTIRVRYPLREYLSYKVVAADTGGLANPRLYRAIREMTASEGGLSGTLKYLAFRLAPVSLLKWMVRMRAGSPGKP